MKTQFIEDSDYTMNVWEDSSSASFADSEPNEFRNEILPWKDAFGAGALTCSPIRKGFVICMDMKCEYHKEDGRGKGDHSMSWKATALEQVVVHSFSVVEPGDFIGTREFEG
jgi:hypothetical protein